MRWPGLVLLLSVGCGAPTMVPLLSSLGVPVTATPTGAIPLEVETRSTGIDDPLRVRGTDLAYGDVEGALSHAVSSATAPWAEAHRGQRQDGWHLFVELIKAEAQHRDGRMKVTLGVRATLYSRVGKEYLAQTATYCSDSALVPVDKGGTVLYSCMEHIGRDIGSWLGAVQP